MLWDLEVLPAARGGKVAVILDRAGASEPGKGISIEEVATFSRQLGYALDAEDLIAFDYRLEVSSPGIERQLRRDEHFAAYVGQPIRVVTSGQVAGRTVHEGLLTGWGPDWITVRPEGGEDVEIPRANLRKARTVFDFSQYDAKPKPGKGGARASKKG
jgi:ribosome maturation factor RimP